jgi:hypothetical protein
MTSRGLRVTLPVLQHQGSTIVILECEIKECGGSFRNPHLTH